MKNQIVQKLRKSSLFLKTMIDLQITLFYSNYLWEMKTNRKYWQLLFLHKNLLEIFVLIVNHLISEEKLPFFIFQQIWTLPFLTLFSVELRIHCIRLYLKYFCTLILFKFHCSRLVWIILLSLFETVKLNCQLNKSNKH